MPLWFPFDHRVAVNTKGLGGIMPFAVFGNVSNITKGLVLLPSYSG